MTDPYYRFYKEKRIYIAHGLRLKCRHSFERVYHAQREHKDLKSEAHMIETEKLRILVKDLNNGSEIMEYIEDLKDFLKRFE